jgi:hypothetical protein
MIPLKDQGVKLFLQLMRAEHLNFISEMLGGWDLSWWQLAMQDE